jgi:hypothetical protein
MKDRNQMLNRSGTDRRGFLAAMAASGAAVSGLDIRAALGSQAALLSNKPRACILLWMQGGPSQFETLSPKPGQSSGGETQAIASSVAGIQVAENMPRVAAAMKDICLIRSMNSKEGSHPRASYLVHTGYVPTATIKYPTIGSQIAFQLGDKESQLPSFVRVGQIRNGAGAGMLGVDYDPFLMADARRTPDNTTLTTSDDRYRRRLSLLGQLHDVHAEGEQQVSNHRKVYGKASKMVLSPQMKAFDLSEETASIRQSYGESSFASGCLLARRLVETGVSCVEVAVGNWDTHQDNFSRSSELCQQMDQPYAFLLQDLKQRGLLESTLVVWMGEFGRTPRINSRGGRDHYPRAYNVALAGAGVHGGQVIGTTDASGSTVTDQPVDVPDLLRTIFQALRVDADLEHMSSVGRPVPVVEGGSVVERVFTG